jgi:hypothetical protein
LRSDSTEEEKAVNERASDHSISRLFLIIV